MRRSVVLTVALGCILSLGLAITARATGRVGISRSNRGLAQINATPSLLGSVEVAPNYLQLERITLDPGEGPEPTHQGPSVLYVDHGTLCYLLIDPGHDKTVIVSRNPAGGMTPSTTSTPFDSRCSNSNYAACQDDLNKATPSAEGTPEATPPATPKPGCILTQSATTPMQAVLLQEGDSLVQDQTTTHYYEDVGTDQVTLLFANIEPSVSGQEPCAGDCF
jgi:hypothetical protein